MTGISSCFAIVVASGAGTSSRQSANAPAVQRLGDAIADKKYVHIALVEELGEQRIVARRHDDQLAFRFHSLYNGDPNRFGCCRLGKCRHTPTSRSDAVSVAASTRRGI